MHNSMIRRGAIVIAVGAAVVSLAACGGGDAGSASGSAAAAPPAAPASPAAPAGAPAGGAQPVAKIDQLTGTSTSVALDPGFTSALKTLGVTPGVEGSATLANGSVTFPITGGNVTVYNKGEVSPYVQGRIEHTGSGLTLTAGDTKVQLDDFVIDPGEPAFLTGKVTANGQVAAPSLKLFDLDGSPLDPITTAGGEATLHGTIVSLSSEAAQALNSVFKTQALKGGLKIGVATLLVKLPAA